MLGKLTAFASRSMFAKGVMVEELGQKQGGGRVYFLVESTASSGVPGCFSQ